MTNTLLPLRRSPVAAAVHSQLPCAPKLDRSKRRGKHTRPIEAIQVGDLVWAWDEVQRRHVRRPVVRLFRHQGKPIVAVTVVGDDGTKQHIECTTEHPFWVEGQGWVAACRLQAGDLLKRLNGGDGLQVASAALTGADADVYNFEVSGVHNYFVGKQGVLVHNESGFTAADAEAPTVRPQQIATPSKLVYKSGLKSGDRSYIGGPDGKSYMTVGMTEDGLLAGGKVQATSDAQVRARQLLDASIDAFGGHAKDGGPVRGFRSFWSASEFGYTDQLDTVNRLTDPLGEHRLPLDVAVRRTWTGKQAERHGWTEVRHYDRPLGSPGNYQELFVEFSAPDRPSGAGVGVSDMLRMQRSRGVEVLLSMTPDGRLVVSDGTAGNVSVPAGQVPFAHTHPDAAIDPRFRLPSDGQGDVGFARAHGNKQAVVHDLGVTIFDSRTVIQDLDGLVGESRHPVGRRTGGAWQVDTTDLLVAHDGAGNVVLWPSPQNPTQTHLPISRLHGDYWAPGTSDANVAALSRFNAASAEKVGRMAQSDEAAGLHSNPTADRPIIGYTRIGGQPIYLGQRPAGPYLTPDGKLKFGD